MARKGSPIPARFEDEELAAINAVHAATGLSGSEIIRRAVRLLALEVKRRGSTDFVLTELLPLSTPDIIYGQAKSTTPAAARLNEEPQKKHKK